MKRINVDSIEFTNDYTFVLDGQLFTGIAEDINSETGERSEQEIQEGVQSGVSREWTAAGTLRREAEFRNNVLHGRQREWHDDGRLWRESVYEYGICLHRTALAPNGSVDHEYRIEDDPSQLELLELMRKSEGDKS